MHAMLITLFVKIAFPFPVINVTSLIISSLSVGSAINHASDATVPPLGRETNNLKFLR